MSATLTIGDFACATLLSVKTLRHYHRVGLLTPADVDAGTGYRRYATDQNAWRTEVGWPIFSTGTAA
jgi:DNA-binding transcriptional MerR regulator